MNKARVILADTDESYIQPLELKFIEEFFQDIDLEVITDEDYFQELFVQPQNAELLVISENLYNEDLLKHSLGAIFILTEQKQEESTDRPNVYRVHKYTSIKGIFGEITGNGIRLLKNGDNRKDCQIVLVTSAGGGTGKTTVAIGISACLSRDYKKVLYINASYLQSYHWILNNRTPITDPEIYARFCSNEPLKAKDFSHVLRTEQFTYLPPFRAPLISLGLEYSVYLRIAEAAKESGEFDYIVIDADSHLDADIAALLEKADKVLVTVRQSRASQFATNLFALHMSGDVSDKYLFICNDFQSMENNVLNNKNADIKFTVTEYVDHISNYDNLTLEAISQNNSMRRAAFLVL